MKERKSNYLGWLIKIGDPETGYIIPTDRFIRADSYTASAYMQDLDPWTDADGYVHRNAVQLKALKVEFETPAMLTDEDFAELMWNIDMNLTNAVANECYITAFIPRYNRYDTQKGYLADIDPQIYGNYEKIKNEKGEVINGILRYNPIRFAFIGGVYSG